MPRRGAGPHARSRSRRPHPGGTRTTLNLLPRPRRILDAPSGDPLPPQGYRLTVRGGAPSVEAPDGAGEFYARCTTEQLRRLHPEAIPDMVIEDWPDFAVRGVMLDISRDKVPTLETVERLVAVLATQKINHVQLYMEHTFAYDGHEVVWARASPFTAEEMAELDGFCRRLHVELSANQNCLGHMERWLAHDRYRPLAIRPDGFPDHRGRIRPPTTIRPADPASLTLVRDLLGQLVATTGGRHVHVGLDEPWELDDDRFGDYLAHIAALRAAPELDGREMLMWGDIVAHHPDQASALPDGVTVCEWGYEADSPFAARTSVLAAAGRPFWVSPGTSSWNSILGRTTNMVDNVRAAVAAGRADGATGLLTTDWGDNGHLQYLPVSAPGFAWAAAMSWCAESNAELDLATALDTHVFEDPSGSLGGALLALGDAHRLVEPQLPNMSVLALPLYAPTVRMGTGWTEGMTVDGLDRVRAALDDAGAAVAGSTGRDPLVRDELANAVALVDLLVRDARARLGGDGSLASVPTAARRAFADEIGLIIDCHRDLWLARNRPGGLEDSVGRLSRLRAAYG
ncbi:MAG TPA: glycoside hydrolase family 20 zincin-like fold domain-containing protein [Acidimicrobiales bacterium]|nr:glycoside hydrolase family 20 zincin-like fold domain-containing protein [Acidimicrobiales bacterium]